MTADLAVRVGIVMGSDSDLTIAAPARDILTELGVGCEVRVLSAHRTPHDLLAYGGAASGRGQAAASSP